VSELPQRPPGFVYSSDTHRAGELLRCEEISLRELAERFGTPLYVYSARTIRERVLSFELAFRQIEHAIYYSVKANSNLSILRLLEKLGCGFDVVSGGELERVRRTGRWAARHVVFSGVGKTAAEIGAALRAGILLFNVESESELDELAACAAKFKRVARIAFRVNPDISADTHPYISTGLEEHKFGVPISQACRLYARAAKSKHLRAAGVSVHIGSQISDFAPFRATLERVAELVRQLREAGHQIEWVDAGGGLGINYHNGKEDFRKRVNAYARAIVGPLRGLGVKLLLEPGRSIVGSAGVLVTRVLYRKTNGTKKFVVVDAGMNDLIRPSLYRAEHQVVPVRTSGAKTEIVDIVGPVCESGDFFARDRELPTVAEGELLAILDAGAYGMALASNYNTRPRPAEVLVNGKTARIIRKRETAADLMRAEMAAIE
jgi:diaminopimelate decarboxylase